MITIPLSSIEVRKRQRSSIEPGPLTSLREAILATGLLHPPVVWQDGEKYVLSVGERRFRAIEQIAKSGRSFIHDNEIIPPGVIPVTMLSELLDGSGRHLAELNENIERVDLHWSDRCQALADYHELMKTKSGAPRHGTEATAKLLIAEHPSLQGSATIDSAVHNLGSAIKEAVVVAAALSDPKVSGARNAREAYAAVLKKQEDKLLAELARRSLVATSEKPSIELRNDDLLTVLPSLEPAQFDLILGDPPYGISASSGGFRSRTAIHHDYDDTPEMAKDIAQVILTEGFRLAKPRANLFLFCDIRLWAWLRDVASRTGWTPFPRPGIWLKSHSEGLAPWGSQGFRITTEFFLYATKGGRGLVSSPTDFFDVPRVSRAEREHGAEKPDELMRRLIGCSTLPGESILDPCCGSGSSLVAARALNRKGLGIEKDPDYYTIAFKNIFGAAAA
jgi:DNA modification methylase